MLLQVYIFHCYCHNETVVFSLSRFELKGNRNAKAEHSEQLNVFQKLCRTVKII